MLIVGVLYPVTADGAGSWSPAGAPAPAGPRRILAPMPTTASLHARARSLAAHPRIVPATALVLRARTVRPAWRFALRELARRPGLVLHVVRESGAVVGVRHGTGDVVTLGEIFHERDYAPPPPLAARLDALEAPRLLDLGANAGMFGVQALARWPGASCVGYEPDPANAAVHERVIAANGWEGRWELRRAAAGAADGTAAFVADQVALSRLAAVGGAGTAGSAIQVPVRDVLPEIARADLVKMDIEGGEWAILGDPRFIAAPPRAVTMEYHPEGAPPGADPRRAAVARLEAAGLEVRETRRTAHGAGMLWAWRR
jgi:FkbM family methyltransferase